MVVFFRKVGKLLRKIDALDIGGDEIGNIRTHSPVLQYGYDAGKIVEMQNKLRGISANQFEKIFTEDRAIKNLLDYYYLLDNSKIDLKKARTDTFNLLDSFF